MTSFHLAKSILLCGLLAGGAAADAIPPPVRVPIVVVSADPEAQAVGEAYVAYLSDKGLFSRTSLVAPLQGLFGCLRKKSDRVGCVRSDSGWKPKGPAVVVLISGQRQQTWECIGIAAKPANPSAQRVSINVPSGLFGSDAVRTQVRRMAADCVMAAGSESGW